MPICASVTCDLPQAHALGCDGEDLEIASPEARKRDPSATWRPRWEVVPFGAERSDSTVAQRHQPKSAFTTKDTIHDARAIGRKTGIRTAVVTARQHPKAGTVRPNQSDLCRR